MEKKSAHYSIWKTSDFMVIVTLISGFILEYLFIDLGSLPIPMVLRLILGGIIISLGVIIVFLAKKEFQKEKQPSVPGKPTTKIVNTGVYKLSRNPLYLGLVVAILGIGCIFDNLWIFLLTVPLVFVFHWFFVIPEEKYLEETFGEEYLLYKSRVRRWL